MKILHSTIQGKGTPLLILHGYFGMSDNWKSLGKKFAEHYQVHLIDQRNHGRSFHSNDFNYELLVSDLHNYIQHHQLENSYLLGHSMGGKTAMLFAVMHPNLIQKLIIVDIAPKQYDPHHDTILKGLNAIDFSEQISRAAVDEKLREYVPQIGVRQFLLKNVYWREKGQLDFRFHLKSLTENNIEIGAALPKDTVFNKKTLFLKGDQSDYISLQDESLIRKHFPESNLQEISHAGHWLHAENPQEFYDFTLKFLS